MVALLVALSIMAVLMTVAMPTWRQAAQREKEAELIFRGQQYARAIGLFQKKAGPGVLPPSIDALVDGHYLRKKYTDPITRQDFDVLSATQPTTPGGRGAAPAGGGQPGRGAAPPTSGSVAAGQTALRPTPGTNDRAIVIGDALTGALKYLIPDPGDMSTMTDTGTSASGIAVDAQGNIYAADVGFNNLRKYARVLR